MNKSEHRALDALPLAQAAARLGISPDALRMRINRGKIKGFKRGGRLFAVLDGAPDPGQRTVRGGTEQPAPSQSEQANQEPAPTRNAGEGPGRADSNPRSATVGPGEPSLPLVIEFQKVELTRLLRDNARLNQRFDQLMEELRHLREMQTREQVLRQQDQALRQRAQTLIERLSAPPVPPADAAPAFTPPGAEAATSKPAPSLPDPGPSVSMAGSAGAPPVDAPGGTAAEPAEGREPSDLAGEKPTYAESEGGPSPTQPAAPSPGPPSAAPSQADGSGADARRDTAELADMLKDIGTSLRRLDRDAPSVAAPNPARIGPPPPAFGDRRAPGDPAGRPSGPSLGPPPGRRPAPHAAPPVRSEDNEASLLEILGRMGPSAEDRRTAARLMKRLLKGRAARPRGDDVD